MRSTRPRSTGSLALKLTIPQIPHINLTLMLGSFNNHAVLAEVRLYQRSRIFMLEDSLPGVAERVRVNSQHSAKPSLLHPHPKEFAAHNAIEEMHLAVFQRDHGNVFKLTVANRSSNHT